MAVETAADRDVFVNPEEFGVTATYTPGVGSPVSVNGIFDSDYFAAEIGAGVAVEGARLRFLCPSEDLPGGAAHGDSIVIAAVTYKVREIHPDGTGFTELVIEKQ